MNLKRATTRIAVLFILIAAIGATSCSKGTTSASPKKQSYEYTTLSKGSIESTVTSSGTLAVVSSVSVLAQMSGQIEKVFVDYNDHVKKGQLLATINTDLLKIQEKSAKASVDKYQAMYDLQALNVQNSKTLYDKGLLSDYDYKSAVATLNSNKADLDSAKASLEQIQTEINQYAYITSPIDGIVLTRSIDPGSNVTGGSVASSTSLFTLTGDLTEMEIEAEVDELDISSVTPGQSVRFTVEAHGSEVFEGTVKQVRLVPETSDNLVYYYVIILVENRSGKLLPGMTASVTFIKQRKDNVLTVPSAALRFTPTTLSDAEKARALFIANLPAEMGPTDRTNAIAKYDEDKKSSAKSQGSSSQSGGLSNLMGGRMMGPPPGGWGGRSSGQGQGQQGQGAQAQATRKPLWYVDESGKLAAVMVQPGISDLTKTEIVGADALEGKKVILKVKAE